MGFSIGGDCGVSELSESPRLQVLGESLSSTQVDSEPPVHVGGNPERER